MNKPKKEIIKAIYIKVANDSLEFVTISSKEELQSKIGKIKLAYPSNEIVVKTFCSIDCDCTLKFYKFICEVLDNEFVARVVPCSKFATFNIRHIFGTNQVIITLDAISEEYAFYKAHKLYKQLYIDKYIK